MKKSVNLYVSNYETDKKFHLIKEIGYDEFFTGIYDKKEDYTWQEQLENAKRLNLNLTMMHCSYNEPELNYFWLDSEIGEKVCDEYINQIKSCQGKGVTDFVVHLNGSKESVQSQIGLERLKKLLEVCDEVGINLAVENLYSREEVEYIFSNLKHKRLKMCYDCGHENFLTKGAEFPLKFAKYITVVHLHDNFGLKDDHLILSEGSMDLDKLAKKLALLNDNVSLSAEIKLRDDKRDVGEFLKDNFKALTMLEEKILSYKTKCN